MEKILIELMIQLNNGYHLEKNEVEFLDMFIKSLTQKINTRKIDYNIK